MKIIESLNFQHWIFKREDKFDIIKFPNDDEEVLFATITTLNKLHFWTCYGFAGTEVTLYSKQEKPEYHKPMIAAIIRKDGENICNTYSITNISSKNNFCIREVEKVAHSLNEERFSNVMLNRLTLEMSRNYKGFNRIIFEKDFELFKDKMIER